MPLNQVKRLLYIYKLMKIS